MLEGLKELCGLNGISGDEKNIRDYIINKIDGKCKYSIDPLGNVIAFKKGVQTPKNKIMIAAHMDEVGMIVTHINEDGTLNISPIGGVEPTVAAGRQICVGNNFICGVIGSKAIHNMTAEERKTPPKFSDLYVDFGAEDLEEAKKIISIGDSVYFSSEYTEFANGMIASKAIDDRAGCAIMLDLINQDLKYDITFVFTVQEEIGTRGAKTSAFSVQPDIAVILEATTAADIPLAEGDKRVCSVSKGAVVSFMDRATVYDKELYRLAFETAAEHNIPIQTKTMIAGGNDSGSIHVSGKGVRTIAISVPSRYLHSPSVAAKKSDIEACEMLCTALLDKLAVL